MLLSHCWRRHGIQPLPLMHYNIQEERQFSWGTRASIDAGNFWKIRLDIFPKFLDDESQWLPRKPEKDKGAYAVAHWH